MVFISHGGCLQAHVRFALDRLSAQMNKLVLILFIRIEIELILFLFLFL